MARNIGILTAGGDSPGLNAAIRGVGKAAQGSYDFHVIGFRDGFRGLMENRAVRLGGASLSGILTTGGTILGTSREKPDSMLVGGHPMDMTDAMADNYYNNHLDALVCLGGGGTQKSALMLAKKGLRVLTLPKTIDNDVAMTDVSFGFDTALGIATDAIDRLHSTAHSHHRIIVVEVMGHNAGWLALGAGLAGGADVVLIPEIPYDVDVVAEAILQRSRGGKRFSIVAVAEGAMPLKLAKVIKKTRKKLKAAKDGDETGKLEKCLSALEEQRIDNTGRLSRSLEDATGLEARVTILGHVQRGGTPSAADRLLATRLGAACADLIQEGVHGVMVASRGEGAEPVPLELVAGHRRVVPPDHPWIDAARRVGMSLGDE
jgi:ATP-dependent phosphofructokinase / diphosphate-dependent phosphofructokinase